MGIFTMPDNAEIQTAKYGAKDVSQKLREMYTKGQRDFTPNFDFGD
jgi:hypothetical protein